MVLDSQNRENEGDLVIAAESITTEQMAFMIRHTRYAMVYPRFRAHANIHIVDLSAHR